MMRLSGLAGSRPCSIEAVLLDAVDLDAHGAAGRIVGSGTGSASEPPARTRSSSMRAQRGAGRPADVVDAALQAVELLDDRQRDDHVGSRRSRRATSGSAMSTDVSSTTRVPGSSPPSGSRADDGRARTSVTRLPDRAVSAAAMLANRGAGSRDSRPDPVPRSGRRYDLSGMSQTHERLVARRRFCAVASALLVGVLIVVPAVGPRAVAAPTRSSGYSVDAVGGGTPGDTGFLPVTPVRVWRRDRLWRHGAARSVRHALAST